MARAIPGGKGIESFLVSKETVDLAAGVGSSDGGQR
jgi:hypothetical protein